MLFGTYAVALLHMIRLLWDTRNFFILRKKKKFHTNFYMASVEC